MEELLLFTDGSVNTKSNIGYGGYLLVSNDLHLLSSIKEKIKIKQFADTSSTKLELQTLLWALSENDLHDKKIIIYTDSQNIVGLESRRERLINNNFISKQNKLLKNHLLYQEFYKITDKLNCEIIKVRGHQVSHKKEYIDQIFTFVDRASRNALRSSKS
jgi:ribonuclease HI